MYLQVFRHVPESNGLYRTVALVGADARLALLQRAGIVRETGEEDK